MFYIDPVCKKRLRRKEEYAILKYGGHVYHFCCKTCKEEFQKNPILYILEGKVHAEQNEEK
ncbi:MAG TPA: YHS domain-containing protein [Candidatus Paceibacterota bacterium]